MKLLSPEELEQLLPAATHAFPGPVPTQTVSSDEFLPRPQTERQRAVEARVKELGDRLAAKQGMSRRRFFQTAAGMAAAYLAMNEVYGPLFAVSAAEAATPELAQARADELKDQFIMDVHTHHLHEPLPEDIFKIFLGLREMTRKAGWNPALPNRPGTPADLLYDNYIKEMFLDSDTKVSLISSAPADDANNYFLTNKQMLETRDRTNAAAGSRRMLAHFMITPGQPGLLDAMDEAIASGKPDSWKGYTIGDPLITLREHRISKMPWRMDDEKVAYPVYEKIAKSGVPIVCVHKGLFPPFAEKAFPDLRRHADVSDVGKAAKDWPQLTFVIYHSGYRYAAGGKPEDGLAAFNKTGRIEWVSDLADIPHKFGVSNVYADMGQSFAEMIVAEPRLAAAYLGILIKGMGTGRVVWGTDALWTGSPQWQIEGLRRLEIPADMQKKHGFAPLGPANGAVKTAIFGDNSARLYGFNKHAWLEQPDRLAQVKGAYRSRGAEPTNLRYGYIRKPG
jgi:predicted TIM-barrel fold metal-dependent hydrolase